MIDSPRKVKILKAEYRDDLDLVIWSVQFKDNDKVVRMGWKSGDLRNALGIVGEIKPEEMKKFCSDIEGKEINMLI